MDKLNSHTDAALSQGEDGYVPRIVNNWGEKKSEVRSRSISVSTVLVRTSIERYEKTVNNQGTVRNIDGSTEVQRSDSGQTQSGRPVCKPSRQTTRAGFLQGSSSSSARWVEYRTNPADNHSKIGHETFPMKEKKAIICSPQLDEVQHDLRRHEEEVQKNVEKNDSSSFHQEKLGEINRALSMQAGQEIVSGVAMTETENNKMCKGSSMQNRKFPSCSHHVPFQISRREQMTCVEPNAQYPESFRKDNYSAAVENNEKGRRRNTANFTSSVDTCNSHADAALFQGTPDYVRRTANTFEKKRLEVDRKTEVEVRKTDNYVDSKERASGKESISGCFLNNKEKYEVGSRSIPTNVCVPTRIEQYEKTVNNQGTARNIDVSTEVQRRDSRQTQCGQHFCEASPKTTSAGFFSGSYTEKKEKGSSLHYIFQSQNPNVPNCSSEHAKGKETDVLPGAMLSNITSVEDSSGNNGDFEESGENDTKNPPQTSPLVKGVSEKCPMLSKMEAEAIVDIYNEQIKIECQSLGPRYLRGKEIAGSLWLDEYKPPKVPLLTDGLNTLETFEKEFGKVICMDCKECCLAYLKYAVTKKSLKNVLLKCESCKFMKKNLVLIFNNRFPYSGKERYGSEKCVGRILSVFDRGQNIIRYYEDISAQRMIELSELYTDEDMFDGVDGIQCFMLSHGNGDSVSGSDEVEINCLHFIKTIEKGRLAQRIETYLYFTQCRGGKNFIPPGRTWVKKMSKASVNVNDEDKSARFHLPRGVTMVDERVDIGIDNLSPGQRVTVSALVEEPPASFVAHAHMVADEQGHVTLGTHSSHGGTYTGVDGMGLFWSMRAAAECKPGMRLWKKDVTKPFCVQLALLPGHVSVRSSSEARGEGVALCGAVLQRWFLSPRVRREPVRHGRLRGTLFTPHGERRHAGVIDLFGTAGGLVEYRAALLASHGFTALALAYFDHDDLPPDMFSLELDYFDEAVRWLSAHARVDTSRGVGVVGISKGAEMALHTAAYNPQVSTCVAMNGCYFYEIGAHTYKGKPLNVLMPDWDLMERTDEGVVLDPCMHSHGQADIIPVWQIRGHVLLLQCLDDRTLGGHQADAIVRGLRQGGGAEYVIHKYPGAGHLLDPPYTPLNRSVVHKLLGMSQLHGGETVQHACAQEHAWRTLVAFLHEHLSPRDHAPPARL